jgi:hypothetical protein
LPTSGDQDDNSTELDELADQDEDCAENILGGDESTAALVQPFKAPIGFTIKPVPSSVSNQLKGSKVAYKFESGWEIGTHKGLYRGKKSDYKGFSTFQLGRKNSYYLDLSTTNYGVENDWVVVKK